MFQKRSPDERRDRFKKKHIADEKKGKADLSKIKCYKCQKMRHYATDSTKTGDDKGKSKALISSN